LALIGLDRSAHREWRRPRTAAVSAASSGTVSVPVPVLPESVCPFRHVTPAKESAAFFGLIHFDPVLFPPPLSAFSFLLLPLAPAPRPRHTIFLVGLTWIWSDLVGFPTMCRT